MPKVVPQPLSAAAVRHHRLLAGQTQSALAELAEVHRNVVSAIENDRYNASAAVITRIAEALGVSAEQLFSEAPSDTHAALFRMYDESDTLLWIGRAISPILRKVPPYWADKVTLITVARFDDHDAAEQAHRRALEEEVPEYAARIGPARTLRPSNSPGGHAPRVYYVRYGEMVKIGFTTNLNQRLASVQAQELLASEPGGQSVEFARHRQFRDLHVTGEWFRLASPLTEFINTLGSSA